MYGLTRPNFLLDPSADSECFARSDIKPGDLSASLQVDLLTQVAPKRMFWGPYGAGKTHTLYKTVEILRLHIPLEPVHVECPDLAKNSTFNDFYRDGIMRSLGESFTVSLLETYVMSKPPRALAEMIRELTQELHDETLATAVMKLYNPAFSRLLFWAWISGVPIKGSELRELGQTQDLTAAEPATLANILITLAEVNNKLRNTSLVLVLDELERMRRVGPDSMQTFVTAFTRLTDQTQHALSILLGVSAAQLSEAPEMFAGESPVLSRIGAEGLVRIPGMPNNDVDDFICKVIAYLRDPNFDVAGSTVAANSAHPSEHFSEAFYPFSDEAILKVRARVGQQNTPREITYAMTRALGRAMLANSLVVTQGIA